VFTRVLGQSCSFSESSVGGQKLMRPGFCNGEFNQHCGRHSVRIFLRLLSGETLELDVEEGVTLDLVQLMADIKPKKEIAQMKEEAPSVDIYEEAFDFWVASLVQPPLHLAKSLLAMATGHLEQGRPELALKRYEQAFKIKSRSLGDKHPDVAESLNNMAIVYASMGKLDQALERNEQALRIQMAALGPFHGRVATSLSNLGHVYAKQDKLDQAIKQHEQALEIRSKIYGEFHVSMGDTHLDMARIFETTGNLSRARKHFIGAKRAYQIYFGVRHQQTKAVAKAIERIEKRQPVVKVAWQTKPKQYEAEAMSHGSASLQRVGVR